MNLLDGFKTGVFAPPFASFPLGEEKFVSFGRTQTYDRVVPYLGGVLQTGPPVNFYRGQEAHFARKLARFNRDLRMHDNASILETATCELRAYQSSSCLGHRCQCRLEADTHDRVCVCVYV